MNQSNPVPTYKPDECAWFQEWKECQQLSTTFDKMILEIRKYGFTFITLLLTADGFLLGKTDVGPLSALGIYAVLLLIIIALFRVDRMHEVFLRGAVLRAMRLEEELHLGLSRVISRWSASSNTATWGTVVYSLFCAAALVLMAAAMLEAGLIKGSDKGSPKTTVAVAAVNADSLARTVSVLLEDPSLRVVVITPGSETVSAVKEQVSGEPSSESTAAGRESSWLGEWAWLCALAIAIVMFVLAVVYIVLHHCQTRLRTQPEPDLEGTDPFRDHIDGAEPLWQKKP